MPRLQLLLFAALLLCAPRPVPAGNTASVSSTNPVISLTSATIAAIANTNNKILDPNTKWGLFAGTATEPVAMIVDVNALTVLQGATIVSSEAGVIIETVIQARTVTYAGSGYFQPGKYTRGAANYVVLNNGSIFQLDLYSSNKPQKPGFANYGLKRFDHVTSITGGKKLTQCQGEINLDEPSSKCRRLNAFPATTASMLRPDGSGTQGAAGGFYVAVSGPVLGAPAPADFRATATLIHLYPDINAQNDSTSAYAITLENAVTEMEFYFATGSDLQVLGSNIVIAFARNFLGIWTANPEDWTKFANRPPAEITTTDAIYILNATDFSVIGQKYQLPAFPTRVSKVPFKDLTTVYGVVLDAGVRTVAGARWHFFVSIYSGRAAVIGVRPGNPTTEVKEFAMCNHTLTTFLSGPTPPYPTKRITGAAFDSATSPKFVYAFSNEGRVVRLGLTPFPSIYEVSYIEPSGADFRDPTLMDTASNGEYDVAKITLNGDRFMVVPINANPAQIVRFPTVCGYGQYINPLVLTGSGQGCIDVPAGFAYDYSKYPYFTPFSPKELTRCSAGFYTTVRNTNSCIACPLGQRSRQVATNPYTVASFCPACTYDPRSLPGVYDGCEICVGGTYANTSTDACSNCPPGYFSNQGASFCTPCPSGTYNPNSAGNGDAACKACNSGAEYSGQGATSCSLCPAGQVSKDAVTCTPCLPGQYRRALNGTNGAMSYSCESCPSNTYSAAGASVCTPCAAGSVSQAGAPACTVCPAGQYAKIPLIPSDPGACQPCPAGSFSAEPTNNCTLCPAGSFSASSGATQCGVCPAGQFSGPGQDACSACPPGTASSQPGSLACGACKPTDICTLGTLVPLDSTATSVFGTLVSRAAESGSSKANATLLGPVLLDAVAALANGTAGATSPRVVYQEIPTTADDEARARRTFLITALVEALGIALITGLAASYLFCTRKTAVLARIDLLFKESHSPIDIHGTGIEYSIKRKTPRGGIFTVLALIGVFVIFSYTIILFAQNNHTITSGLNPGQEQAAGTWTLSVSAVGYGGPCKAGVDVSVTTRSFLASTRPTSKKYLEGTVDSSSVWTAVANQAASTAAGSAVSKDLPVCVATWSCPYCMLGSMVNAGIKFSFDSPAASVASFAYSLEVPGSAYTGSQGAPAAAVYRGGTVTATFALLPILTTKDDKTTKGFNVSLSATDDAAAAATAATFNSLARGGQPVDFMAVLNVNDIFLQVIYIPQTNAIGLVSNLLALYSGVVGFCAWVMNKSEDYAEFLEDRKAKKEAKKAEKDAEAGAAGSKPGPLVTALSKSPSSAPLEMFRVKDPEKAGVKLKNGTVVPVTDDGKPQPQAIPPLAPITTEAGPPLRSGPTSGGTTPQDRRGIGTPRQQSAQDLAAGSGVPPTVDEGGDSRHPIKATSLTSTPEPHLASNA